MKIIGGSACCVAALLVTSAAFAQAPNKPIRACADEYAARTAELKADSVSAPEFYHECWWHTASGHATDLSDVHKQSATVAEHPRTEKVKVARAKPVERTRVEAHLAREARSLRTQAHAIREARVSRAANSAKAVQPIKEARSDTAPRPETKVRVAIASRPSRVRQAPSEAHATAETHVRLEARNRDNRHSAQEEHVALLVRRRSAASRVAAVKRREQTRLASNEARLEKRQVADRGRHFAASRNSRIAAAATLPARYEAKQDIQAIPAGLPQGTRLGEQAWIASAGTRPHLAVIVGRLSQDATKGSSLHCWGQKVLYSKGDRWGEATVCDGSTVAGAPNTWFVGYDRVPRVDRRSEKPDA